MSGGEKSGRKEGQKKWRGTRSGLRLVPPHYIVGFSVHSAHSHAIQSSLVGRGRASVTRPTHRISVSGLEQLRFHALQARSGQFHRSETVYDAVEDIYVAREGTRGRAWIACAGGCHIQIPLPAFVPEAAGGSSSRGLLQLVSLCDEPRCC
jgi:hypothetical protein